VFFKRSSAFLATIFASAFVVEIAFDTTSDKLWDRANKGRQWKDIRDKYITN
ncbi:cytochrome b-c1 complex subunit 9, partial [Blyttiomyces helicus]